MVASTNLDSDLAHLITSASCGVAVQAGSAQDLADAILDAFQNQSQLRRMGQAGRVYVIEHYARSTITQRYHELIESVLTERVDAQSGGR